MFSNIENVQTLKVIKKCNRKIKKKKKKNTFATCTVKGTHHKYLNIYHLGWSTRNNPKLNLYASHRNYRCIHVQYTQNHILLPQKILSTFKY